MSLWRQLRRGVRVLTNRRAADQELTDEVQYYLDEAVAAAEQRGFSPAEARRAARLEMGDAAAVREQVRDYGWENVLRSGVGDLRYAARQLRNNPGFATVGVLTLALGIGASTAIFSAVNPILFEPLPYPHSNRLLAIWDIFQDKRSHVTFHTWRELSARSHSFESSAAMDLWQPTMTGGQQPERLDGQNVTAGYFRTLGVAPVLGRDFQEADDRFHGPHVAILSDKLWRRRFGGDRAIVGHPIKLDDDLYTVIGVMPAGFENVLAPSVEVWSPAQYDSAHATEFNTSEWGHHMRMVARLRPGLSAEQARQELSGIARLRTADFPRPPWAALRSGFIVDSLKDQVTRDVRPALLAVLGAVVVVLLIVSVNVTNLLLARGAQRRGEFALRAALGAGRSRLVRQQLAESLLLAALGGVFGLVVAQFGVRALIALSPPGLPRVDAIAVNGPVFAFALGMTASIGLAVGLIPALHASRGGLMSGIQQSSLRNTGGHQLTRSTLVISEVALALMLLVGAGLLLRSLQHLLSVAPGFDTSHLLTMDVKLSGRRYRDSDINGARNPFYAKALEAVRHVPGVAATEFTSLLPLSGQLFGSYGASFEDKSGYDVNRYVVTPGYVETMGITLRRGRFLNEHDAAGAPPALLISQSLARRHFHDRDPIGQRVHVGPMDRPWYTVVGVVDDVKQGSLVEGESDAVYLTSAQSWFADDSLSLVVRTRDDVTMLASAVKNAIWSVDKDQAVVSVATMDELLVKTAAERRFTMIVFEAFALVALALAAIGIYGVLAGSVTERTREIGVRTALGASRGDILGLVVRQGMALTGIGVAIGLGGAAAASRALVTLLFGVSQLDPITYAGVMVLLAGVSAGACWAPAWRAARVDPSITLRSE